MIVAALCITGIVLGLLYLCICHVGAKSDREIEQIMKQREKQKENEWAYRAALERNNR